MNIHFICSGNTYRSRLAEAYAKSVNKSAIFDESLISNHFTSKICFIYHLANKY